MPPDRMRVLVLAAVSLALLIAGTFFLGWHVGDIDMGQLTGSVSLKLRSMEICVDHQGCIAVEFARNPRLSGMYPTFGSIVYFGSIAFALLVAWQAATRVLSGHASEPLSKGGYGGGTLLVGFAVMCGYILVDQESGSAAGMTASIHRGWGPLVQILGLVVGIAALYNAAKETIEDEYRPVVEPPVPQARVVSPPASLPAGPAAPALAELPETLRGKLRFLVLTAEITRGGIDARREDGSAVLVMWRDVVGAVARRLPQTLEGAPIVDIVSTAGSTLRIAPWTRLTGEPLAGDGDDRVRALLRLVGERAAQAKLDPATRQFLEAPAERPAQLPDTATLAAHDNRLA